MAPTLVRHHQYHHPPLAARSVALQGHRQVGARLNRHHTHDGRRYHHDPVSQRGACTVTPSASHARGGFYPIRAHFRFRCFLHLPPAPEGIDPDVMHRISVEKNNRRCCSPLSLHCPWRRRLVVYSSPCPCYPCRSNNSAPRQWKTSLRTAATATTITSYSTASSRTS